MTRRHAPIARFGILLVVAMLAAMPAGAQSPTPAGRWLHENKRIQIEIFPCDDRLCAKIVWFKWPNDANGLPLADLNNPDSALRTRPLLGLTVLQGLRPAGENSWVDGEIYNPDDGVRYQATMAMEKSGNLRIRAYLMVPLLGKTLVWTRVPQSGLR